MCAGTHTNTQHTLSRLAGIFIFCHVVAHFPPNHLQFCAINLAKTQNWQVWWFFHCYFFPCSFFVVDVLLLNSQWVRVFIADENAFYIEYLTQWKVIMVCRFNSNENTPNGKFPNEPRLCLVLLLSKVKPVSVSILSTYVVPMPLLYLSNVNGRGQPYHITCVCVWAH